VSNNQIGIAQMQELMRNKGGRELLKTIAKSTSGFKWGDRSRDVVPSNGSMFFVNTGKALIAITAGYVLRHTARALSKTRESSARLTICASIPKKGLYVWVLAVIWPPLP
jgi:hypothetical protein